MKNNRREFLKLAAVTAIGVGAGRLGFLGDAPAHAAGLPTVADFEAGLKAKHWGMAIFTAKMTPELIEKCRTACHSEHNVPDIPGNKNIKWFWGASYEESFPTEHGHYLSEEIEHREFPLLCNQCETPMCVKVCPTQATFQRPDGIVMMDFHRCIGCRYCMAGCPFGARSFNFQDPRPFIKHFNPHFPTRMRGVVEKCNFCAERLAIGKMPMCVEAAGGALVFGDLADENSDIRKVLREHFSIRRKPDAGTSPSVYYIL
jgi:molybdopterin-containing oxidoreductase family iron-sulfur binding subunit